MRMVWTDRIALSRRTPEAAGCRQLVGMWQNSKLRPQDSGEKLRCQGGRRQAGVVHGRRGLSHVSFSCCSVPSSWNRGDKGAAAAGPHECNVGEERRPRTCPMVPRALPDV